MKNPANSKAADTAARAIVHHARNQIGEISILLRECSDAASTAVLVVTIMGLSTELRALAEQIDSAEAIARTAVR